MALHRDLTDAQWSSVEALFIAFRARKDPRGRPPRNTRMVLNGVLWVLSSGAAWAALPTRYPDYRTCHRRFKVWFESGVLQRAMHDLYGEAGDAMCEAIAGRMHRAQPVAQNAPAGTAAAARWRDRVRPMARVVD
ncbi:transposase [Paraburkholderia sp. GAS334]|uniref:transposase n=1 Tax=Paraburkholderia sp. GAS334 TaxID=3035131 RepID=UPI003D1DAA3C